jgi:PhnB protein
VASCDAAIERAVQAGATVTLPPRDMFWGERYGTITDPFGQVWSFSHRLSTEQPAAADENPPADPPWGHAAA